METTNLSIGLLGRSFLSVSLSLFLFLGLYNSIKLHDDSFMNEGESLYIKRLDEITGVKTQGRRVAATRNWKSIAPKKKVNPIKAIPKKVVSLPVKEKEVAPTEEVEELPPLVPEFTELYLVEVFNSTKYPKQLTPEDFSGSITISGSSIDSLSISLPDIEPLRVYYSDVVNNKVFDYEINGEKFSGIIYGSEKDVFIVNLANGPYQGTKLKFSKEFPEPQESVASNEQEFSSEEQQQMIENSRYQF